MMRKTILGLSLASLLALLTACSSNDSMKEVQMDSSAGSNDMAVQMENEAGYAKTEELAKEDTQDSGAIPTNRMIILQAQLQLNVKSFEQAQSNIEQKVNKYGGYIVESNIYRDNDDIVN